MEPQRKGRVFIKKEIPTNAEINKNFIIRYRKSDDKKGWHKLIGAGQYEKKFGKHYRDKHFQKAMDSGLDRIEFKIRGYYIITFVGR